MQGMGGGGVRFQRFLIELAGDGMGGGGGRVPILMQGCSI